MFALSSTANVSQQKFDDNVASVSKKLIDIFVDVHMRDVMTPLMTTWLDRSSSLMTANRPHHGISAPCEQVIKNMSLMCRTSMSVAPTQTRAIMELTMSRVIETLRSNFTKFIGTSGISVEVMDRLRFDFELLRVAIDPMSSKSARDGAARLIELASRLATSFQLQAERIAHRDLELIRISTHLRILGGLS
jgi:hypothetical protein